MIKVMVVDDEPLSRLEIVNMIPWTHHGYIMAGTAENGKQGLELYDVIRPNIVLVDIKMPVMGGIEMMRCIPDTDVQFIVLSGYAEFDFAQEALRLGASDYIMKWELSPEMLLSALEKAKRNLPASLWVHADGLNLEREREMALTNMLENWYEGKTDGNITGYLPFKVNAMARIDVFSPETGGYVQDDPRGTIRDILSECVRRFYTEGYYGKVIVHAPWRYALLMGAANPPENLESKLSCLISKMLRNCLALENHFAFCEIGVGEKNWECAYRVNDLCEEIFFQGWARSPGADSGLLRDPGTARQISRLILSKDSEGLKRSVEGIFREAVRGVANRIDLYRDLDVLRQKIYEMCGVKEGIPWASNRIATCGHLLKLLEQDLISAMESAEREMPVKAAADPVDLAIEYINKNYASILTLGEVAKAVSVNPTYLSAAIKRRTGVNFVDMLNAVRVEQAKKRLLTHEYSIGEISAQVGFNNSAYFAKVFKRFTGVQPLKYRGR